MLVCWSVVPLSRPAHLHHLEVGTGQETNMGHTIPYPRGTWAQYTTIWSTVLVASVHDTRHILESTTHNRPKHRHGSVTAEMNGREGHQQAAAGPAALDPLLTHFCAGTIRGQVSEKCAGVYPTRLDADTPAGAGRIGGVPDRAWCAAAGGSRTVARLFPVSPPHQRARRAQESSRQRHGVASRAWLTPGWPARLPFATGPYRGKGPFPRLPGSCRRRRRLADAKGNPADFFPPPLPRSPEVTRS